MEVGMTFRELEKWENPHLAKETNKLNQSFVSAFQTGFELEMNWR